MIANSLFEIGDFGTEFYYWKPIFSIKIWKLKLNDSLKIAQQCRPTLPSMKKLTKSFFDTKFLQIFFRREFYKLEGFWKLHKMGNPESGFNYQ